MLKNRLKRLFTDKILLGDRVTYSASFARRVNRFFGRAALTPESVLGIVSGITGTMAEVTFRRQTALIDGKSYIQLAELRKL